MNKKAIVGLFSVVIISGLVGVGYVNNKPKPQPVVLKEAMVQVEEVRQMDMKRSFTFTGTVEPIAQVSIVPKVGGRIGSIYVDEGQYVKANQLLAQLEHTELSIQVQQAEQQVESAKANLNKAKSMSHVNSQVNTKQAKANLEALQAKLALTKAGARPEEIAQAKASVEQAKINLESAQREFQRLEKLYNAGSISRQQYDGASDKVELAQRSLNIAQDNLTIAQKGARKEEIAAIEAQVRQAQAALELAQTSEQSRNWENDLKMVQTQYEQAKAQLELARTNLGNTDIRTLISGVVAKKYLDTGAMANPGAPIFMIMDTSKLKMNVDLPEGDFVNIHVGDSVTIKVDSLPGKNYEGKVTKMSPFVDADTRKGSIEISIDNKTGALRPGMFARGSMNMEKTENALTVPRQAVLDDDGQKYVYIVEAGKAKRVNVGTGIETSTMAAIKGELKIGDKVVSVGWENLRENTPVKISGGGI